MPADVLPGARDGTVTINLHVRTNPFEHVFFTTDLAVQWNDRTGLDASAGRVQAGCTFADAFWTSGPSYRYQTLSGDDPDTHLPDDTFVEYRRGIGRNVVPAAGVSLPFRIKGSGRSFRTTRQTG